MDLKELRKNLDIIDNALLKLLAKRMFLIPKVAEYKKKNNIPRYQPEREKEIIKAKRKIAVKLKLNPDFIEAIYKKIIEDAHRIEKEIIGK